MIFSCKSFMLNGMLKLYNYYSKTIYSEETLLFYWVFFDSHCISEMHTQNAMVWSVMDTRYHRPSTCICMIDYLAKLNTSVYKSCVHIIESSVHSFYGNFSPPTDECLPRHRGAWSPVLHSLRGDGGPSPQRPSQRPWILQGVMLFEEDRPNLCFLLTLLHDDYIH